MNKKIIILIPILIIAVIVIGTALKGNKQTKDQAKENGTKEEFGSLPNEAPKTSLKGVSLSPKSFESKDFQEFFNKAKETGEIISWAGDWQELANVEEGGPAVVASLASQYKYTPIIEAQFFTQSTGKLLRPLNENTKASYKKVAADFTEKFKLPYLGLGIEINTLYEKSPADFEEFTKFFSEVYDAVKAVSPKTKVFTIFQLEKMKGLQGGLFGGKNDPSKNEWELIQKFPKSDIIAFTTYPSLIYKNPSEIPADYYSEIPSHLSKPIAFIEIGWPSGADIPGWQSSEAEQREFIKIYFRLSQDLKKEFDIWSFLYDQKIIEPFNSMGLIGKDDTLKESWNEWRKTR